MMGEEETLQISQRCKKKESMMSKLNLGSGNSPLKEFVNIDVKQTTDSVLKLMLNLCCVALISNNCSNVASLIPKVTRWD